jgi:hypothetical protein
VRTVVCGLCLAIGLPAGLAAQPPDDRRANERRVVTRTVDTDTVSLRPFAMGTEQLFLATHTFDAVFGQSHQRFFGGGLQVVVKRRYFAEVVASRFRKTGERAFIFNNQTFRLGLPLTAEVKPLEVIGGVRFDVRPNQRFVPYAGGGVGTYGYKETSPSSDPDENVDTRHHGFIVGGGVELRLHRWIRVDVDEQYTHVPGILGLAGVSKSSAENDLGGIALRVKIVVGR